MSTQPPLPRSSARDDSIDGRRYLAALRRSAKLIAAIVVTLTVAVLVVSLALPRTYSADAQLILPQSTELQNSDAQTAQRYLATLQTLVTSPNVLSKAAPAAHASETDLESSVTATVDPNANLITITATDGTAEGAARKANAVTRAFVASETEIERTADQRAQAALTNQIRALRAGADSSTQSVQAQITALNARLAELSVSLTNAGSDLQIARNAPVPKKATSPKPLRNAVLGLFVAIFIGVLVALARNQLRPGITDQREVSDLLEMPVLATIPEKPGRRSLRHAALARRIEQEGYRTLSASLRLTHRKDHDHVILTTSALHAEGKTSVTLRLGRALAESGRRTLVVSADLRWPRIDALLELEGRPGFSDLLEEATQGVSRERVKDLIVTRRHDADVLPAGTLLGDKAAALLTTDRLEALTAELTELGYAYLLVDAPPLLGIGDAQILASQCDELLVVSRIRSLHLDNLLDLRAMIDRLPIKPLGVVVIGGTASSSPYYAARPDQETDAEDDVLAMADELLRR